MSAIDQDQNKKINILAKAILKVRWFEVFLTVLIICVVASFVSLMLAMYFQIEILQMSYNSLVDKYNAVVTANQQNLLENESGEIPGVGVDQDSSSGVIDSGILKQ